MELLKRVYLLQYSDLTRKVLRSKSLVQVQAQSRRWVRTDQCLKFGNIPSSLHLRVVVVCCCAACSPFSPQSKGSEYESGFFAHVRHHAAGSSRTLTGEHYSWRKFGVAKSSAGTSLTTTAKLGDASPGLGKKSLSGVGPIIVLTLSSHWEGTIPIFRGLRIAGWNLLPACPRPSTCIVRSEETRPMGILLEVRAVLKDSILVLIVLGLRELQTGDWARARGGCTESLWRIAQDCGDINFAILYAQARKRHLERSPTWLLNRSAKSSHFHMSRAIHTLETALSSFWGQKPTMLDTHHVGLTALRNGAHRLASRSYITRSSMHHSLN
ncbi:uncharacterized protein BDR25DRAFT_317231 [Lindgomyces ingoldianus]|uniref:Uncharacterized protein n=1 Tax=Lindgomyces ingoldianus TaxID=673940 RepID=A0ACB6QJ19_9PLEO|nr:uncharacterized protein BDR25DRAFT_317231 [Lindgomyces ingoldianus]KAF2466999.1 hypothetical protein BDR25DRAFT_317231 [Lindgomyces ingoldianus]